VKQSPLPDMILKTPLSRAEIAKRLFHPDRDLERRHEEWRKAMERDPTRPSSDARTEACPRGLVAFLPPPYPRMTFRLRRGRGSLAGSAGLSITASAMTQTTTPNPAATQVLPSGNACCPMIQATV
jgi:hypothetical protein